MLRLYVGAGASHISCEGRNDSSQICPYTLGQGGFDVRLSLNREMKAHKPAPTQLKRPPLPQMLKLFND
ncbi:hypothetical protein [Coleofasciculus sp.]|uniref:hypothetical protein n=1 Tax=Coleofasciculus sp. TaxID=3100458 RepID=UPI003A4ACB65